ncbi:MAG: HEAT repeat domain-containing protein, partial [Chloroflexota bacterium]
MWLVANVVVSLQGIVAWGVASWLCDARQAKRIFPLANAAKILGAIVGSAAVAPLVLRVRLEDLLVLWAMTLAVALALVLRLRRGAPAAPVERQSVSLHAELVVGFRVVRGSPLLRYLAASLVLFSVLYFALALPFTRAAREAYPREDELAAFLGLFGATTTGAAFLASLFLANVLYRRFGVVNAIFAFTLIYLGGFAALVLTNSFAAVAAARWLQLAWLAGIADAAYQALFNPVPAERRDQMRAFMEGVPGQAGIALAGLLLLVGDQTLEPRQVALGGVVIALATAAVIWRTRGAYRDALVTALRSGRPEPFLDARLGYAALAQDHGAIRVAIAGCVSDDMATRRASAQILGALAPAAAHDALVRAAGDGDPIVRAAGLHGGARLDARGFAAAARASEDHADPAVRAAALLVLHRSSDAGSAEMLRAMTHHADAATRHVALEAIAASDLDDAVAIALRLASDTDGAVRRTATDVLIARDPAQATRLAEEALGSAALRGRALDMLEALPAARRSRALQAFAAERRDAALRDRGLTQAVPATGDLATLVGIALRRRGAQAAREAVRGAALLSGRVAPVALLDGLASGDSRVRAEALETLESHVRPDLVRPLLLIWEGEARPGALADLARDDDPWIRDCAAHLEHSGGDDMPTLTTLPTMERVLFLHKVPLFAELDPADLQQVARVATERAFTDGETVFRQSDRGDALYIVIDG